jgi:hypothetical protein
MWEGLLYQQNRMKPVDITRISRDWWVGPGVMPATLAVAATDSSLQAYDQGHGDWEGEAPAEPRAKNGSTGASCSLVFLGCRCVAGGFGRVGQVCPTVGDPKELRRLNRR